MTYIPALSYPSLLLPHIDHVNTKYPSSPTLPPFIVSANRSSRLSRDQYSSPHTRTNRPRLALRQCRAFYRYLCSSRPSLTPTPRPSPTHTTRQIRTRYSRSRYTLSTSTATATTTITTPSRLPAPRVLAKPHRRPPKHPRAHPLHPFRPRRLRHLLAAPLLPQACVGSSVYFSAQVLSYPGRYRDVGMDWQGG